jgi:hypothetical protein
VVIESLDCAAFFRSALNERTFQGDEISGFLFDGFGVCHPCCVTPLDRFSDSIT